MPPVIVSILWPLGNYYIVVVLLTIDIMENSLLGVGGNEKLNGIMNITHIVPMKQVETW